MICEPLGFTNMQYFPPLILPSMSPAEEERYLAEHPEETAKKKAAGEAEGKKPFPWWILLVIAGTYYYSQR